MTHNLVINSWLQKADHLYIDWRCLWYKMWIDSACILLWLSIEQIMKILIIQNKIKNWEIIIKDLDLNEIHKLYDKEARKITSSQKTQHSSDKVLKIFHDNYPEFNINEYEESISKVNEYFDRRYVKHCWTSINILLLYKIDELYFNFRDLIDENVVQWTIDEIFIRKEAWVWQTTQVFNYAFQDNTYFRPRNLKNCNDIIFFWENGAFDKKIEPNKLIEKFYESYNIL